MGLADRLKDLRKKTEDAAVEHKEQIHQAVQKAEAAADERTGGKYHEQIQQAGAKADAFVDNLSESEKRAASKDSAGAASTPDPS
jgi:DNA-binding protein H-NS